MTLLRDGTGDQKMAAARALGDIAVNSDANKKEMKSQGVIGLLNDLSQNGTSSLKCCAATALGRICDEDENSTKRASYQ